MFYAYDIRMNVIFLVLDLLNLIYISVARY
jgi:hypothetical protein